MPFSHHFVFSSAILAAFMTLAACGDGSNSSSSTPTTTLPRTSGQPPTQAPSPTVPSAPTTPTTPTTTLPSANPTTPTTTLPPTTTTTTLPRTGYESLIWEAASRSQAPNWSQYVFTLIAGDAKALLTASDWSQFCPNFSKLTLQQKVNAAGQLIAGITKYESAFNPASRYLESTMGTDPVTGLPVYSEGLMQLSYQDTQWATYCEFDWSKDKYLSATDPQKTILDPYKNLNCGIRILANQVQKKGTIILSSGAYWSTLKSNSPYQKISEIEGIVSSLSFCK